MGSSAPNPWLRLAVAWLLPAALLAQSCHRPGPEAGRSTTPPPASAPGDPPRVALQPFSAFALYLAVGPRRDQTALIPIEGDQPVSRGAGFWVTTNESPQIVTQWVAPERGESLGLPTCPCTNVEAACLNEAVVRSFDADRDFAVTWVAPRACSCYGVAGYDQIAEITAAPLFPLAPPDGYGNSPLPCEPPPPPPDQPVALVAATLFTAGSGSSLYDECGNSNGRNIYDAWGDRIPLAGDFGLAAGPESDWQTCREDGRYELWDLPLVEASPETDLFEPPPEDRSWSEAPCDGFEDFAYPAVVNGRLCWRGWAVGPVGEEGHWAACAPLTPERCPSPLDPCGDPSPGLRQQLDENETWWVAPGGQVALTTNRGAFRLLRAEVEAPSPPEIDSLEGELIGVLFFRDASSLAAAMARTPADPPPPPAAEGDCSAEGDCGEGLLCDPLGGGCWPPCQSDSDCSWRGRCGARCHDDGRCGPEPTGDCDEEFPCEAGLCEGGECVECRETGDCDEGICAEGRCEPECWHDEDCAGSACRRGRCQRPACEPGVTAAEWGERCWAEVLASHWDLAEARCRCGLALAPTPRVLGALLYNLGRIAEGRGEAEEARRLYHQSLEVRGENPAVRQRLEALSQP